MTTLTTRATRSPLGKGFKPLDFALKVNSAEDLARLEDAVATRLNGANILSQKAKKLEGGHFRLTLKFATADARDQAEARLSGTTEHPLSFIAAFKAPAADL